MSLEHSKSQHGSKSYRLDLLMDTGPYQSTQFRAEEGGSVKDFHLQLTGQNGVTWPYLAPVEARKSLYTR